MLGELTGGGLRAYYKLENANDSSPNSFNLTANGTVNYVSSNYSSGADFGSSGTTNGLYYGANILSSTTTTEVFVAFRFKLNTSANTTRNHFFYVINTNPNVTTGREYSCFYTISAGVMTITFRRISSTGTNIQINTTFSVGTTGYYFVTNRFSANNGGGMALVVYNSKTIERLASANGSNTNSGGSSTGNTGQYFTLGNSRALNQSVYAIIDEFFVSDNIYTQSESIDGGIDLSHRSRYSTYSIGRL